MKIDNIQIFCKCGCGKIIQYKKRHKYSKTKIEYIKGHFKKGKNHEELYGKNKAEFIKNKRLITLYKNGNNKAWNK